MLFFLRFVFAHGLLSYHEWPRSQTVGLMALQSELRLLVEQVKPILHIPALFSSELQQQQWQGFEDVSLITLFVL